MSRALNSAVAQGSLHNPCMRSNHMWYDPRRSYLVLLIGIVCFSVYTHTIQTLRVLHGKLHASAKALLVHAPSLTCSQLFPSMSARSILDYEIIISLRFMHIKQNKKQINAMASKANVNQDSVMYLTAALCSILHVLKSF